MNERTKLVLGLILASAACGDDRGGTDQPGIPFASCKVDDDCDEGLVCAQGGVIAKHCARSCEKDNECVTRLGDGHECVDSVCVQICNVNPECTGKPPAAFNKCGSGLSCRGQDDDALTLYCSYLCAADTWGDGPRDEHE